MELIQIIRNIACAICKALGGEQPELSIKPAGTMTAILMSSILLDKMDEIGDDKADIHLPDTNMKVYRKEDVQKSYELQEVSSLKYIPEEQDCDDIAAVLFGKFAGLLWTEVHALNWFIDTKDTLWFVEPQTKKLSRTLEKWQGWNVRFFIGR